MKSIIIFFKSLFTPKKEEIFCETVKKKRQNLKEEESLNLEKK